MYFDVRLGWNNPLSKHCFTLLLLFQTSFEKKTSVIFLTQFSKAFEISIHAGVVQGYLLKLLSCKPCIVTINFCFLHYFSLCFFLSICV